MKGVKWRKEKKMFEHMDRQSEPQLIKKCICTAVVFSNLLRPHTDTLLLISLPEFIPDTFMTFSKTFPLFSFSLILQAGDIKGKNGNGRKVASHFESKLAK